ncbi:type IV toxin-antitoxin system AbiEi family antitoxin domain-containing protein [Dactylosporangium sp. NPDC005555]|uniref:type IV toxin-antitoxin system AbiEi family antitoxin domain-containing protein n=1 Tax=Dactylosporangium sp. NPDC005555 TaxID=3154889 RepID=UPI0033AAE995
MWDELIEAQAGVVTRRQALAEGWTPSAIRAHLDTGRWSTVHHGVYRTFTGEMPRRAQLWAALLRAGADAALSHLSAAELHGLVDQPSDPIHVTIPGNRRVRPLPGVLVHHRARLAGTVHPGPALRRTRVEDTVLDLAEDERRLPSAIGWLTTACSRGLTTPERLATALRRRKKMRWRRLLEATVDDAAVGARSVLELRYLKDVERGHRLPGGRRQARRREGGATRYRDVEYRAFATVVELDGRAFHPEEHRRRDQRRDNATASDGQRTLRYGWADVVTPCATAIQVARALRAGGWRGRLQPCRRPDCPVRRSIRRRTPRDPEDF